MSGNEKFKIVRCDDPQSYTVYEWKPSQQLFGRGSWTEIGSTLTETFALKIIEAKRQPVHETKYYDENAREIVESFY